jgi:hypothetical protein
MMALIILSIVSAIQMITELASPTPRFTRAGQSSECSRGAVVIATDVVGGCKELSAGGDACL